MPTHRVRMERDVAERDPVLTWWQTHKVARNMLTNVKANHPSLTVLSITAHFYGAPAGVINDLLRSVRDYNTHIEVLEMSNVGISKNQLTIIVNLLQRGHVWSINLGETNDISNNDWCDYFANHVESTNLCCMYASLQHPLQKEVKQKLQVSLRANRLTEKRWRMESRLDTLKRYKKKNWWNPPIHPKGSIRWWPNHSERGLLGDTADEIIRSMETHGALVHRSSNVLLVVNQDDHHTKKILDTLIIGLKKAQCAIYVVMNSNMNADTPTPHNGCHYMLSNIYNQSFIANIDAEFSGVHFRHVFVGAVNVHHNSTIFCHNMGGLLRRLDGHPDEGIYIHGDPTNLMKQSYFRYYAQVVPSQDMRLVHYLIDCLPPPNTTIAYLKSLVMMRRK